MASYPPYLPFGEPTDVEANKFVQANAAEHLQMLFMQNIARGTTDPGY